MPENSQVIEAILRLKDELSAKIDTANKRVDDFAKKTEKAGREMDSAGKRGAAAWLKIGTVITGVVATIRQSELAMQAVKVTGDKLGESINIAFRKIQDFWVGLGVVSRGDIDAFNNMAAEVEKLRVKLKPPDAGTILNALHDVLFGGDGERGLVNTMPQARAEMDALAKAFADFSKADPALDPLRKARNLIERFGATAGTTAADVKLFTDALGRVDARLKGLALTPLEEAERTLKQFSNTDLEQRFRAMSDAIGEGLGTFEDYAEAFKEAHLDAQLNVAREKLLEWAKVHNVSVEEATAAWERYVEVRKRDFDVPLPPIADPKTIESFAEGWDRGLRIIRDVGELGATVSSTLQESFASIADAFIFDLESIEDLLKNILRSVARLFINQGIGLGLSQIFGTTASAKGNVFDQGNVVPFARGGIVSRPTIAPMALFGERGPEAIVPLKRTASGDLGIKSEGGSGGGGQVNITIYAMDSRDVVRALSSPDVQRFLKGTQAAGFSDTRVRRASRGVN